MRRKVSDSAFYVTVLALLSFGSSSFSSPVGQEAAGPIQQAKLVSPSHGWALAGGRLLWTDNDGLQWNDITPELGPSESLDAVLFSDDSHAWTVIGQASETGTAKLYIGVTSDGGTSWARVPIAENDTEMLESYGSSGELSFADSLDGWVILTKQSSSAASYAGLFSTRDGGKSWWRLPDPPVNGSIRFISPQTGWLCGGVLGHDLYVTHDGGHTWQRRILTPPSEVQKAYRITYHAPVFRDINHGTIAATFAIPKTIFGAREISFLIVSYQTTDGGDTWTLQNVEKRAHSTAITTFDSAVFGVLVSGSFVVTGNQSTRHVGTLPAGLSPQHFDIEQADFVDSENGWILISHDRGCHKPGCVSISALISTKDGGKTMMLLLQNTQINRSQGSPAHLFSRQQLYGRLIVARCFPDDARTRIYIHLAIHNLAGLPNVHRTFSARSMLRSGRLARGSSSSEPNLFWSPTLTARSIRRAAERKAKKLARRGEARLAQIPVSEPAPAFEPAPEAREHLCFEPESDSPASISDAQLAANRANAKLSTGPKTLDGKATACLNAVKTGLTGRTVLLHSDDAAEYRRHVAAYEKEFSPLGQRECDLVQSIADTAWRLARIPALEFAIYAHGRAQFAEEFKDHDAALQPGLIELKTFTTYEKQLRNLQLQESRLSRRREKEIAELRELQKIRRGEACLDPMSEPVPPPKAAASLVPEQTNGFEFSDPAFVAGSSCIRYTHSHVNQTFNSTETRQPV